MYTITLMKNDWDQLEAFRVAKPKPKAMEFPKSYLHITEDRKLVTTDGVALCALNSEGWSDGLAVLMKGSYDILQVRPQGTFVALLLVQEVKDTPELPISELFKNVNTEHPFKFRISPWKGVKGDTGISLSLLMYRIYDKAREFWPDNPYRIKHNVLAKLLPETYTFYSSPGNNPMLVKRDNFEFLFMGMNFTREEG